MSLNVAEAIPYKTHKERNKIVSEELRKHRFVQVWSKEKIVYSARKWKKVEVA
jgi:hypothetical protein